MFDEKFLEEYPLSTSCIQGVFKIRITRVLEEMNVPSDIKEDLLSSSMNSARLLDMLQENPCVLFEVFDDIGIHFFVYPFKENGKTLYSHASVNDDTFLEAGPDGATTRRIAEQHAVRECFEHLEVLLSTKKVNHGDTVPKV